MTLAQNHPNPAGLVTTLRFTLPSARTVTLTVHDVMGRVVAIPVDHEFLPAGSHQRRVDLARLSDGLYFYTLSGSGPAVTRRMIVAR